MFTTDRLKNKIHYLGLIALASATIGCDQTDESTKKNLQHSENQLAHERKANQEAEERIRELMLELAKNEDQLAENAARLAELEKSQEQDSDKISELEQKNAGLVETIASQKAELSKLQTDLEDKKAEISELSKQLLDVQKERDELQSDLGETFKSLEDAKERIIELENQVPSTDLLRDLESSQTLVAKLEVQVQNLELKIQGKIEAENLLRERLALAQAKLEDLASGSQEVLGRTLTPFHGLWIASRRISTITDASCYQVLYVKTTGSFEHGIACNDGRVQTASYQFDRFFAAKVPNQLSGYYVGDYGFVVDGTEFSNTCLGETSRLLDTGNRLIFDLTRQNAGENTQIPNAIESDAVVVQTKSAYLSLENAAYQFGSAQLSYEALVTIAENEQGWPLATAAANFLASMQGKGTLGCFDQNGTFTEINN